MLWVRESSFWAHFIIIFMNLGDLKCPAVCAVSGRCQSTLAGIGFYDGALLRLIQTIKVVQLLSEAELFLAGRCGTCVFFFLL